MKVTFNAITKPINNISPEEYIIYCARVSSPQNRLNHDTAPKLLKYLIDAGHWSPFEMISIAFEIETSRAIAQQILRHRSFSFQEFSQRYSKVEEIETVELRYQAEKNRQSSTDVCDDYLLNNRIKMFLIRAENLYQELLKHNIAKECARMVLPLSTQTTIVMHGTLRSWIHFLNQRCDDHAQKEIRLIAEEIRNQLSKLCPWTATALNWLECEKFYSKPLGETFKPLSFKEETVTYEKQAEKILTERQDLFEKQAEKNCKYFTCQHDSNGEIAINHCTHNKNKSEFEGNCTCEKCPLINHNDQS